MKPLAAGLSRTELNQAFASKDNTFAPRSDDHHMPSNLPCERHTRIGSCKSCDILGKNGIILVGMQFLGSRFSRIAHRRRCTITRRDVDE